jgi:hypothetical protein
MGKLFFSLFISIFYAVGFGLLWYGINLGKQSTIASNWPSVTGTITNLSLEGNSDSDGSTYDGSTYEVRVEYSYSVMGRTYTNSRLAFGYGGSSGRKAHQEIFNKLQQTDTIRVLYNPNDPATSTLSFGIHRSIKLILIFAITWLAFVFGFTSVLWLDSQPDDALIKNIDINP